ncbi:MAG: acyltransferase [Thermoleophilia bacterium]|nr:acyltransferase [Thermoleophilia bacterium]
MSRRMTIALAQLATDETKAQALEKVERYVADASQQGAGLIVLPDLTCLPFFPQYRAESKWMELAEEVPDGPSTQAFCNLAREYGIAIVGSIYEKRRDGVYYDAGIAIDKDGNFLGSQRMMHIPEEPGFNEKYYYKAGNSKYPVFEIDGIKVGIAIGQDLFYPEHHRLLAIHGAELVVGPNAIGAETDPLVLCSQAAAVMNQFYVGVANRTGPDGIHTFIGRSHVASPDGSLLAKADGTDEQLVVQELDFNALSELRRSQNYWLRDRRPETYGDLVLDEV